MIINRIINQSEGKRYFFNIEKIGFENSSNSDNNGADKSLKIIATDGRNVWESFKSKGIKCIFVYILILIVPVVIWNDLIQMKPEGIEDSIQYSAISLALLGTLSTSDELKEEDLVVEIGEMGSTGNLNVSWKLKQMLGITVNKRV